MNPYYPYKGLLRIPKYYTMQFIKFLKGGYKLKTYLVIYDLRNKESNKYLEIDLAIGFIGTSKKFANTTWIVKTDKTCYELYKLLDEHKSNLFTASDKLMVAEIKSNPSQWTPEEDVRKWINENLS